LRQGRTVDVLLLIVGLGFALLGQLYFASRREYVWDGVFFWCVAVSSFGLLLWRMSRPGRGRSGGRFLSWVHRWPLRTLSAVGGATCALAAGWLAHHPLQRAILMARQRSPMADFSGLLWLWLVGVFGFLLAFVPPREALRRCWATRMAAFRFPLGKAGGGWVERAALVALLVVALAARAVDLEHIPANLGGDEGTQGLAALELVPSPSKGHFNMEGSEAAHFNLEGSEAAHFNLEGSEAAHSDGTGSPLGNPFSTGWFGVPTMSFLAWGLSMRLFGESVAGLRALSALIGTSTVLTTALLARELWGRRVAWLAAIALAFSHFHIHFSRLGSNQIADGLFITLTLYLLVRGLRSRRAITFALAGAVMGLGWYGYFGARLIGFVVAFYLAWRTAVEHRFLARYGRQLLVGLLAAFIVMAPLLFHYASYPENLGSRSRQVSIFTSGWLAREQEITGRSAVSLLLQQVWRSISAFHYTLDTTFWYRPSIPLLDVVSGVLFVLGLVWTAARGRWPANGLILLWFWSALIAGWVLTENPPSSMRLVIVAPALAILVGLGLNWLLALGRRLLGGEPSLWIDVAAGILVAVAAVNLYYYFAVYTPSRVYGNPTAEVATELGRRLALHDDGYTVYFHAPPYMYWDFGTLGFLARDVVGMDVPLPGEDEPPKPNLSRGARFVFLPERLDELDTIRARIPGGAETRVHSSADGRLLYVSYEVSPQ